MPPFSTCESNCKKEQPDSTQQILKNKITKDQMNANMLLIHIHTVEFTHTPPHTHTHTHKICTLKAEIWVWAVKMEQNE